MVDNWPITVEENTIRFQSTDRRNELEETTDVYNLAK